MRYMSTKIEADNSSDQVYYHRESTLVRPSGTSLTCAVGGQTGVPYKWANKIMENDTGQRWTQRKEPVRGRV